MLRQLHQAIINRLASLNVPVYQADCVPDSADFPYITMAVAAPLAESAAGTLTLTLWDNSTGANAARINQADAIHALLPARGLYLSLTDGAVTLTGGTASCVRDASILGMRMVWKLHCFPAA